MDKLKGAVGLGGKHEEGQEPVSGGKGEGTTAEPFDAGNNQKATQAADKTEDPSRFSSEHAYLGSAIDADQERAADASKSEPTPSSTTAEEQPAKEEKKSGGGFLSKIGIGGGKKKDEEKEAQAGAEREAEEKAAAEKNLPPNHLGSAVPEGASKDLADPGTVAPGQTDGLAAQKDTTGGAPQISEPAQSETPRSPSTSVGKQPDRGSSIGSSSGLSPDRSRSTGGGAGLALAGSRGEGRGSYVPTDAPKYKKVENPDRIPIAGGKRIGEEQYQTRRASMAPPPSSPPRDMPKLDREGSPDPVTANNTTTNTAPTKHVEGKNTAPQQMKDFSMGEAIKDAETKPTNVKEAGATEDLAPDEGPTGPAASSVGDTTSSGGGSATKDKLWPLSSSGNKENTSSGGHARRGSVFDKLKDKIKGGKSGSSKSP